MRTIELIWTRHPWLRAYAGGLLGTAIFVWLVYGGRLAGMQQLDVATAMVVAVFGIFPTSSRANFWYTGYYHAFVLGALVLPWIYSGLLYKAFTHSPLLNGVVLGVLLWSFRELAFVPAIGLEHLYVGFTHGTRMVMASLLAHVAYGLSLCLVAGKYFANPAPVHISSNEHGAGSSGCR